MAKHGFPRFGALSALIALSLSAAYELRACGIVGGNVLPPVVTGASARAYLHVPYAHQLEVSGWQGTTTPPYNFRPYGPLPPGLTLTSSGLLTGIPSAPFRGLFSAQVTDAANCWQVVDWFFGTMPETHIVTPFLPVATAYAPYSASIESTPGTKFFLADSLPLGLSITVQGRIGGTAPGPGLYTPIITQATGTIHNDVREWPFVINAATCGMVSVNVPNGRLPPIGDYYRQRLSAVGGVGPYHFSIGNGTLRGALLPRGLALSSDGTLSGVITEVKYPATVIVVVRDARGCFGLASMAFHDPQPVEPDVPAVRTTGLIMILLSITTVALLRLRTS